MTETLDGSLFGPQQPCFGCSPTHPHGFHLSFQREGDGVVTRFLPTELHQGPPGIMHGGLVATVADEAAAWALIAARGRFGFTTTMEARFARPVRVGKETVARAAIVKDAGRIVRVEVRVAQDGLDCFTGTFAFAVLDEQAAEALLGGPLPEAWRRFSRPRS